MDTPYTYIFIRKDLPIQQQIIQASHAALEAGFRFNKPETVTHLVLIGVDNQDELTFASHRLTEHGIEHEMFFEPDFDTGFTAIATIPLVGKDRKPLKKYQLYTV